jgi:3',5'-cyclic AMP phosphodiesterase CpdA
MTTAARFLHITDTHITGVGVPLERDDHKTKIPEIEHATREGALRLLLDRLREKLLAGGDMLDAVVFTGDSTLKGNVDGHQALLDLLLQSLGPVGITPATIVATPGNHDVPKGTAPSSSERYRAFLDVWRKAGCVTPWLDGIDSQGTSTPETHRLVGPDGLWAIYPINSANWSHVDSILPDPLKEVWPDLHLLLKKEGSEKAERVRKQLDALAQFDMARVSDAQLEELRHIVNSTPAPSARQIRIAALHHHLSAPSLREEVKPFADFTNLQLLRRTLHDRAIDVVMHGHKHEYAGSFDYIDGDDGTEGAGQRRILVLSGATFDNTRDEEAARLITLDGMPYVPALELAPVGVPRSGTELKIGPNRTFRLWRSRRLEDGPVVIQGTDFDEVYHQACAAAAVEAVRDTLIVHLDLQPNEPIRLPVDYPLPDSMTLPQRETWFNELVEWWQQERSSLDRRVPYLHGIRLNRFAGNINQLSRVRSLLAHKASSRALATLVDPVRDFDAKGRDETFASFCLVQFRRRNAAKNSPVDVIGYYRAQEFARWWPINVAELRSLQHGVIKGTKMVPGRITTITAEARSIGKSPTQVAMPVIDRWLDQHPERIHVLANCLLGFSTGTEIDELVKRQWMQTLEDLNAATRDFNPDGVPVPIEGLEALASNLTVSAPKAGVANFLDELTKLVAANRVYAKSLQTHEDFENWGARDHLAELRSLSQALLYRVEEV